jgi:hypothetical protein
VRKSKQLLFVSELARSDRNRNRLRYLYMEDVDVDLDQDTRKPSPLLLARRYEITALVTSSGAINVFITRNTYLRTRKINEHNLNSDCKMRKNLTSNFKLSIEIVRKCAYLGSIATTQDSRVTNQYVGRAVAFWIIQ